jgi:hypothetical protein
MPVQQRGTAPVVRSGGLVPPDHPVTGAVEIRVHGVAGTPPAQLLSDLTPDQVAGDNTAGFYRTVDDGHGRHIEAYSWGGLTSRSALRVLWILILPFALSNLAGWMCQPSVARHKARFLLHRFSARAAALLLTLNVVILLQMIGEDLIAVRCRGVQTCTNRLPPVRLLNEHFFAGSGGAHLAGRAMAVGALLPVVAIVIFELLSHASARAYERTAPAVRPGSAGAKVESAAGYGTGLDSPRFWNGFASARRLSVLHTSAAIAFVAATLAVTAQRTVAPARSGGWVIVLAAVGGVIVLLALILLAVDTAPSWTAWALFGPSVLALAGALWLAWSLPAPAVAPAYVADLRYVADGMWVAQAVIVSIAFLLGWLSRRNVDTFPRAATGLVSLLAIGIVNAFGSLIIILVAGWIAAPEPGSTLGTGRARDLALFAVNGKIATWIIWAVIAAVLVLILVAGVGWLRSGNSGQCAEIRAEYGGSGTAKSPRDPWTVPVLDDNSAAGKWLRSIARFRYIAKGLRQLGRILLVLIPTAVITVVVVEIRYWSRAGITPLHWMTVGASYLALLLPVVLVFLLRLGWRNLGARRGIGIVWDVATFWPRAYHPFAPPCYAERAVPELGRRIDHLQANDADVTVAAHSQGTVVTAATLLQRTNGEPADAPPAGQAGAADTRRPVGLLTFGSPLDTLYRWAFPAYFDRASLLWIAAKGARTDPGALQWTNCYYRTDYVGRTWIDGARNQCLTDPPTADRVYRESAPAIGTHSGYWQDHRVWDAELSPDPHIWTPATFTALATLPYQDHPQTLAGLRALVDKVEQAASAAGLARLHIGFKAGPDGAASLTVMTEQTLPAPVAERFRKAVGEPELRDDAGTHLVADSDSALAGTTEGD